MPNVDERQIKISLPVTIGFAVGLAMIVAAYFGAQLAVQKGISELAAEIRVLKDHRTSIVDPAIDTFRGNIGQLITASAILLNDRGYNREAEKLLNLNKQ